MTLHLLYGTLLQPGAPWRAKGFFSGTLSSRLAASVSPVGLSSMLPRVVEVVVALYSMLVGGIPA